MVTKEELEKALTQALKEKFIGEKVGYRHFQYDVTDFAIKWLRNTYRTELEGFGLTTKGLGHSQSMSLGIYSDGISSINREIPYFLTIYYSKKRGNGLCGWYDSHYEWTFSDFTCTMCGNEETLEDAIANCKELFDERKSHRDAINEKADKIVAYIKQEFGNLGWSEAREILDAVKIRGGW